MIYLIHLLLIAIIIRNCANKQHFTEEKKPCAYIALKRNKLNLKFAMRSYKSLVVFVCCVLWSHILTDHLFGGVRCSRLRLVSKPLYFLACVIIKLCHVGHNIIIDRIYSSVGYNKQHVNVDKCVQIWNYVKACCNNKQ